MNLINIFKKTPSIQLNVLVYQEDNEWIAHCLQMDIVSAGKNEKEVEDNIVDLITAQVIYALQNDNLSYIFKPAPDEEWAKLEHATRCGTRTIKIDEKIKDSQTITRRLPINKVEFCFA